MKDHRRDVALFRYSLIREAAEPSLSHAERGLLVRELVGREHAGPSGVRIVIGRSWIDRWIRAWHAGGFDALLARLTPSIDYSVLAETVDPNELAGQLQIPVNDGGAQ